MDFASFFEIFERHSPNFPLQRYTMLCCGILTDITIVFALYVIKTSSVDLLKAFRTLMYCNVIFPVLMCNVICLLFVPYILLPYPVVLNTGPLRFGIGSTLLYSAMVCWFGAFSALSVMYSISLNYITVCHFSFLRSRGFVILKWIAFLFPLAILVGTSFLLAYSVLSDTQSVPSMLETDIKNAILIEEFAVMVIHLKMVDVDLYLILGLFVYVGATVSGSAMIIRTIRHIRAKRHEFSDKTYRLHLNVLFALVLYCGILFVQFGLPLILFAITAFFELSWMTAMPLLEVILFFPISLFGLSTNMMYLIVIRPFRKSAARLIKRVLKATAVSFFGTPVRRKSTNATLNSVSDTSCARQISRTKSTFF